MAKASTDKSFPSEDSNLPRRSLQSKEAPELTKSKPFSRKKMLLKNMLIVLSEKLMLDKPAENLSTISKDIKC